MVLLNKEDTGQYPIIAPEKKLQLGRRVRKMGAFTLFKFFYTPEYATRTAPPPIRAASLLLYRRDFDNLCRMLINPPGKVLLLLYFTLFYSTLLYLQRMSFISYTVHTYLPTYCAYKIYIRVFASSRLFCSNVFCVGMEMVMRVWK